MFSAGSFEAGFVLIYKSRIKRPAGVALKGDSDVHHAQATNETREGDPPWP